jgi:hypothetical protein
VPYSIYLLLAKLERIEMALQACPNYSLITEVADKSWIITAITIARILDSRVGAGSRWLNIIMQIDSGDLQTTSSIIVQRYPECQVLWHPCD